MSSALNLQLMRMATLLQLEQRARRASRAELGFVMVNETAQLLSYHQAVFWEWDGRGAGRVAAVSGVTAPDPAGPFPTWLKGLLTERSRAPGAATLHALTAADAGPAMAEGWAEWLPPHALWVPLCAPDGGLVGALLLTRQEPWAEADRHLMSYLGEAYAHALVLSAMRRPRVPWRRRATVGRLAAVAVLLAVLALAAVPVRQSVLAPAEVVPHAPTLARSPFDGVVDRFHVAPNDVVAAGQPLVSLDTTQLRTRLKVAQKAREMAQAEYLQAAQQALADPRAKAKLAVLQARLEQQAAEAAYVAGLIERAEITAPTAGVAVFSDVNDWIGKPVTIGERILQIADPGDVELEIRLPVGDAATLEAGAKILFFRNVAPDQPVAATLSFASYRAEPMIEGGYGYRLKAGFEAGREPLRIGLKGTAKIYGEPMPLGLILLSRPLAVLQRWLAL
ncbi:MAG TPA: HlyD family efflux transporter periplasmic adaptor subunit [Azospirillum sp.]|nr:HlyD family efflux transporter periplasmic adaptor subunit [Azospirillum sp.]